MEMLQGVRDEAATRALIVQENMRYARRQLIWFRKEPDVRWLDGAGRDGRRVQAQAMAHRAAFVVQRRIVQSRTSP